MPPPAGCPLTEGQFLVVKALVDGQTYEQAAARMGRTPSTLRSQVGFACETLGVTGALQCVIRCVREGWLEVGNRKIRPSAAARCPERGRKRDSIEITSARAVYLLGVNLNACCTTAEEHDLAARLMHRLAAKVIAESKAGGGQP